MSLTPVHDFIRGYVNAGLERCHTPGHKGNSRLLQSSQPLYSGDLTEIADGTSAAVDVIEKSERIAAELYGAKRTLFSCSGSTLAIYAMLSAALGANPHRKHVLALKHSHRSLVDAAILLGFGITQFSRDNAANIDITPDIAAIFTASIDYYGNICDISALSKHCRQAGIPLLVDNAHGAYLIFCNERYGKMPHPLHSGATMTAESAHKTLPALTGAAYLHMSHDCCDEMAAAAKSALELFGTSSPSYLILESLDLCNQHIANESELAHRAFAAVSQLKSDLANIGYVVLPTDPLRITIDVNAYGYIGADFAQLIASAGVVCEMYDIRFAILLFSTVTTAQNTQKVFSALKSIARKPRLHGAPRVSLTSPLKGNKNEVHADTYANQQSAILASPLKGNTNEVKSNTHTNQQSVIRDAPCAPREAYFSPKQTIPTRFSVGRVCAGVHVTTPPCAPIVFPGEIITDKCAVLLEKCGINKVDVVIEDYEIMNRSSEFNNLSS